MTHDAISKSDCQRLLDFEISPPSLLLEVYTILGLNLANGSSAGPDFPANRGQNAVVVFEQKTQGDKK
jgi:hypothetical protein